jgi:hypothetical protein
MQINVSVTDANNIVCEVTPPQPEIIVIDRGVEGNGIVSIVPVTISTFQYLRITYTNGTVQDVGPLTSTAYTATAPITIVGNTISLTTVPIALGGTDATTAAGAIQNLLPSYTGNANKRLGLNSGGTALEWVADGGGTVTSVNASGGTTGLTFSGGPITSSGTLTISGTLAIANGGTGQTTANAAFNALAPSQTGNSGKYLTTDGTDTSWATNPLGTVTSVAATVPSFLSISGSPITTSGTLAFGLSGTALPTTSGGTGLTSFTANGVVYASSTSALTTGSALTFDGSNLGISVSGATGFTMTSSASQSYINLRSVSGGGFEPFIGFGDSSAGNIGQMIGVSGGGLRWTTGGSEQMRLNSTGLGVGTSSPAAELDVLANNPVMGYFRSSGGLSNDKRFTISSGGDRVVLDSSFNSTGATAAFSFTLGGSEQMRLTSTGLGIGTSSPAAKLDVTGTGLVSSFGSTSTAETYVQVRNGTSTLYLGGKSDQNYVYGTAAIPLTFWTNSSEKMRLDSSGNLGLGVTPSAWGGGKAFEAGLVGNYFLGSTAASYTSIGTASYYDGSSWKYARSTAASKYELYDNTHKWYIAPSGTAGNAITFTQAMTLDVNGNLGVGTTSPATRLVVGGSTGNYGLQIAARTDFASLSGQILITDNTGSACMYTASGALVFATGATVGTNGGTERARIDSSGNLLVGRATQINQERFGYTTTTDVGAIFQRANDTQFYPAIFYTSNGLVGYIYSFGTSTSYSTSSDYRLKNTIAPMRGALAKVALLKPVTYKWNADGSDGEGFIAHELAEVCPQAVVGEKDAVNKDGSIKPQGIDTSFLVATLTAAIQEQQAIIESLKARLDAANL